MTGPAAPGQEAPASGLPVGYRRTALTGYSLTAVSLLVALLATPLLARALGPERFGIWAVIGSTVLYLEVLELGLGAATVSAVADRAARGDREGIRQAVATSFWLLTVPGGVALVLSGLAAWALPSVLDIAPQDLPAARLLLIVLAVDLAVSIPADSFGGTLAALRRLDLVNSSLVVVGVAQAVGWVLVIVSGGGLVALGIVTAVLGLAGQAARFLLARRLVPGLSLRPGLVHGELIRPLARLSAWFALSDVNKIVVQRLDVLLVGAVVGVRAAGIYAVGQKLALLVLRAVEPATLVLFPHTAELRARGDDQGVREALLTGARLSLAISLPLATILAFFAAPLIELWVGASYGEAAGITAVLAVATVAGSLAAAAGLVLKGLQRARSAGTGAAVDAVVNVLLSVLLGHLLGAVGVAVATLVAASVAASLLLPSACRASSLPLGALLGQLARAHLLPLLVAASLAQALRVITPDPGLLVLPEALLVFVVHAALLLRTAIEPERRRQLLARLRPAPAGAGRADA